MNDQVIVSFTGMRLGGNFENRIIFTPEQFRFYLNEARRIEFLDHRMTVEVSTPNGTRAEFSLNSTRESMDEYFQMCDEIAIAVFRLENPYTDFLRFLENIDM